MLQWSAGVLLVNQSIGWEGYYLQLCPPCRKFLMNPSFFFLFKLSSPAGAQCFSWLGKWGAIGERMKLVLIIVLTHLGCSPYLVWFITSPHNQNHTCQSSLVLALMPVYESWHETVLLYINRYTAAWLYRVCVSIPKWMYSGVVIVLTGQACGAGAGHTSLLMTFENLAGYRESRRGLRALVLVPPEQAGSSAPDKVRQCICLRAGSI